MSSYNGGNVAVTGTISYNGGNVAVTGMSSYNGKNVAVTGTSSYNGTNVDVTRTRTNRTFYDGSIHLHTHRLCDIFSSEYTTIAA